MRVALVSSNYHALHPNTANGTAIFSYSLISQLARMDVRQLNITAFAAGASELPAPIQSVQYEPSSKNVQLAASGKHFLFEQELIAKAFSMQDAFDLYHINIGDGDIALPFARFTKKPIIITIHNVNDTPYMRTFFSLYSNQPNLHFIAASNAQRTLFPHLKFLATIHHGVDENVFTFDSSGGESLMWAGRAIPEKGPDIVLQAALETGHTAKLFGIEKEERKQWLKEHVLDTIKQDTNRAVTFFSGYSRNELIPEYQSSKALVLPVQCEEAFGFVLAESMSCGTPVIAYARGSIPEVIEDGKTGFIVNASKEDLRGNWLVKKTGHEGLCEAINRIYALSDTEYAAMRVACRERVIKYFTIHRMAEEYITCYRKLIADTQ